MRGTISVFAKLNIVRIIIVFFAITTAMTAAIIVSAGVVIAFTVSAIVVIAFAVSAIVVVFVCAHLLSAGFRG